MNRCICFGAYLERFTLDQRAVLEAGGGVHQQQLAVHRGGVALGAGHPWNVHLYIRPGVDSHVNGLGFLSNILYSFIYILQKSFIYIFQK